MMANTCSSESSSSITTIKSPLTHAAYGHGMRADIKKEFVAALKKMI